ncbi:hypothetical protein [Megasphaera sueciensis]|uniref:hypothetical protein n=1 Tax=Megasphaera sueciensis TaxID=349094 RepID=UPI003D06DDF5
MEKRISYILLGIFIFGIILCIISWFSKQWFQSIEINIGTGFITSAIIIYLYDMTLNKYHKKENELRKNIALNSLYEILKEYYEVIIYGFFKSSAKQEIRITSLDYLISDEYFREVDYLDFNKSPYLEKNDPRQNKLNVPNIMKNYQILLDANKFLSDSLLSEVLLVFGNLIDTEIITLIQKFRFSSFISYSYKLPQLTIFFNQPGAKFLMLRKGSPDNHIKTNNWLPKKENEELMSAWKSHNKLFIKIVKCYNNIVPPNKQFNIETLNNNINIEWGICRSSKFKAEMLEISPQINLDHINKNFEMLNKKLDQIQKDISKNQ